MTDFRSPQPKLTLTTLPEEILFTIFKHFYQDFKMLLIQGTQGIDNESLRLATSPLNPALTCHAINTIAMASMRAHLAPSLEVIPTFMSAKDLKLIYKNDKLKSGCHFVRSMNIKTSIMHCKPIRDIKFWKRLIKSCPNLKILQIRFAFEDHRPQPENRQLVNAKQSTVLAEYLKSEDFKDYFENCRSVYPFWFPDFENLLKELAGAVGEQHIRMMSQTQSIDDPEVMLVVTHENDRFFGKLMPNGSVVRNSWVYTKRGGRELDREIVNNKFTVAYRVDSEQVAIKAQGLKYNTRLLDEQISQQSKSQTGS